MALSSGLKANHTMRCLDLNIPPGDDEFARLALTSPERLLRHANRGLFQDVPRYTQLVCKEHRGG